MASLPIDTVKQYLLKGKATQLGQWAKENGIKNIETLIDAAYREIQQKKK